MMNQLGIRNYRESDEKAVADLSWDCGLAP